MTATQAPTPGPLSADDVKLLVKGDLLRGTDGSVFKFDRPYEAIDYHDRNGAYLQRADGTEFVLKDGGGPKSQWFANLNIIGRHDADGWMPWFGGEPTITDPTVDIEVRLRNGELHVDRSPAFDWTYDPEPHPFDIIAFRLAPTAPVEASGSERDTALSILQAAVRSFDSGDTTNLNGVLDDILDALRPQPSGETREAVAELIEAAIVRHDPTIPLDSTLDDADAILALLSARPPARAEGQEGEVADEEDDDDDPHSPCSVCGDEYPDGVLEDGRCPSCCDKEED